MANGFQIDQQDIGYSQTHSAWRYDFTITMNQHTVQVPIFVSEDPEHDRADRAKAAFKRYVAAVAKDVDAF